MKYDIIIWDFNGTLLDDVDFCYGILVKLLTNHNVPLVSKYEYKEKFSFPVIEYYREIGFDVDDGKYNALSIEFMKHYQELSLKCSLYPKIKETLSLIKNLGCIQVCLSASQIDNLKQQLIHFNIDKYFDYVLGLDNIHAKSKIHIGQNWIKEHGYENKKILCIGDSSHDFEVANALNADCVLMSYGHYNKHRLEAHRCPVFDNTDQLVNYLLNT